MATDAKSLFQAVTAVHVRVLAEMSLLSHLQYLRELLDKHILSSLFWLDTRDMLADGLTKGSTDRAALTEVCSGTVVRAHQAEEWKSKVGELPRTGCDLSAVVNAVAEKVSRGYSEDSRAVQVYAARLAGRAASGDGANPSAASSSGGNFPNLDQPQCPWITRLALMRPITNVRWLLM